MARATKLRGQDDLSNDFLRCRTYGHSWDDFYPDDMRSPSFGWRESLRCTRCTTERHRLIGRHGEVMQSSYYYADGYQMDKGVGKLDRADLRGEMFARLHDRLVAAGQISLTFESDSKSSASNVTPIRKRKSA